MADGTERRILENVAESTGDAELTQDFAPGEYRPMYKMYDEAKIPVSKHHGQLWHSRKDAGVRKMENRGYIDNWDEAIRYYKNDQRTNVQRGDRVGPRVGRKSKREAENIVFSNTSAIVPAVYAKNPQCEVTNEDKTQDETFVTTCERTINAIMAKSAAPGVNLKPTARRNVVMTTLTNISYVNVGYTFKEQGSEEALKELEHLAEKLANAKGTKEIEEAEGCLMALEQKIDFLRPSGPFVKFLHPKDVVKDPDGTMSDLSDSKWVMYAEYISTAFINAVYAEKSSEDGRWKSIYRPTHVISTGGTNEIEDQINSFSLFTDTTHDWSKYGYNDQESFNSALRTKCWYVWDKITRRVYLFNDKDWSWPIWVWDDPYNYDDFFPLVPLEFYTDPEDDIAQSEVMYYLDQQDAVNEINGEVALIRTMARRNIFYNTNVFKNPQMIDNYLKGGGDSMAMPVDVAPDVDLQKAIMALLPPSAQFMQLFNKEDLYSAIDRLSSVSAVMRGEQFKTNTTNDAIETYNSQQQTRLDEKIDAVEEFIGKIGWKILQLCLQYMSNEEVGNLIGDSSAGNWRNMDPQEIRANFNVRVVGGSTQKPTSKAKKEEALKMGQVLGQFANAGRGAPILIILKMFEKAFDEFTVTQEDMSMLLQAVQTELQNQGGQGAQGASQSGGGQPPTDPMQEQMAQAEQQMAGAEEALGGLEQMLPEVAKIYDGLPPEAKMALGASTARGASIAEALPMILQGVNQQGQQAA